MSAEVVVRKVRAKVRSVMEENILLGNLELNLRTGQMFSNATEMVEWRGGEVEVWRCRIGKAIARKEVEIIISIHSQVEEVRVSTPSIYDPSSHSTLGPNFRSEVTASPHSLFPFESHGIWTNDLLVLKISGRS